MPTPNAAGVKYGSPVPGTELCQAGITEHDQIGLRCLDQCQKHVVLGIDAVRDCRDDFNNHGPSPKTRDEVITLPCGHVAVES